MSVDSSGALVCEYCGGRSYFDDKQLLGYKEFRKQMLSYLRGIHDEKSEGDKSEDYLWDSAEEEQLEMADGDKATIRYLYSYEDGPVKVYLTKNNALFVFSKSERNLADRMLSGIGMLSFPPADVKGLNEVMTFPAAELCLLLQEAIICSRFPCSEASAPSIQPG